MLFENSLRPHEAMNQYDFSTLNGILYEHCEGTAWKNRFFFFDLAFFSSCYLTFVLSNMNLTKNRRHRRQSEREREMVRREAIWFWWRTGDSQKSRDGKIDGERHKDQNKKGWDRQWVRKRDSLQLNNKEREMSTSPITFHPRYSSLP